MLQLWKLVLLAAFNSFPGFAFGWDIGTAGGIVNFPSFQKRFGGEDSKIDPMIIGVIISIFNLGCAFGGMGLSKIADKIGRKNSIYIGAAIYLIGAIIQITSVTHNHWAQLLAGRVVSGLVIGLFSVVSPMLISECSPSTIKGELVVFFQLAITLGILAGTTGNFGCKEHNPGSDSEWMIPISLSLIWSVIIIIGNFFMYESPSYLLSIGEEDKSSQVTRDIHGITESSNDSEKRYVENLIETRNEEHQLQKEGDTYETNGVNWTEIFTGKPRYGRRLIIGMGVMAFQQLSGANYFFYFGTSLFSALGMEDAYATSIILGAVNFMCTLFSILVIDKFGRKTCLLAGSAGMRVCMTAYTILGSFFLKGNGDIINISVGKAMIACTCVYIFFFASTWGPVAFVVVSELFPIKTRAMAMACSVAMNWLTNFLISLLTPTIIDAISFKYGFVFSGCLITSFLFVWFLLQETKDCETDEDVNRKYAGEKPDDVEDTNKIAAHTPVSPISSNIITVGKIKLGVSPKVFASQDVI